MGFFSGIKKMFDTGGIGLSIDAPKDFDWALESVPVTVTLTGHKDEPRTITSLDFELEDEGAGNGPVGSPSRSTDASARNGSRVRIGWSRAEPILLEPGEVKVIEVAVPLSASTPDRVGDVIDAIDTVVAGISAISFGAAWYVLSVSAPVEGVKASRSTSTRLKARGEMRVR